MNRILFRAVMAFALGEVAYELTNGISKIGIVMAVSIFCGLIYGLTHKISHSRVLAAAYAVVFVLGFLNIFCNEISPSVNECVKNSSEEMPYNDMEENGSGTDDILIMGLVEDAKQGDKSTRLKVRVYYTECGNHMHTDVYNCMLYVDTANGDKYGEVKQGEYIYARGELNQIKGSNNPGAFDERVYYAGMGIDYRLDRVKECVTCQWKQLPSGAPRPVIRQMFARFKYRLGIIRENVKNYIYSLCDEKYAAVYTGILLGDKSGISEETKQLYKLGGIAHILAISSLHMTLIGGLLWKIINKCGVPTYMAGVLSVLLLFVYGSMTGFSVATVRAVIMMALGVWAKLEGRSFDILTGMAVAFAVVLISEPMLFKSSATLMSFTAILGVALAKNVMNTLTKNKKISRMKKKHKIRYSVLSGLVYQTVIQLIMLPVTVRCYYEVYTYSFAINLIVVPLVSVLIMCGLLGLAIYPVFPMAGSVFIGAGCMILRLYEGLCRLAVKLPLTAVNVGHPTMPEVIIYYMILAAVILSLDLRLDRKMREHHYEKTKRWLSKGQWCRLKRGLLSVFVLVGGMILFFVHSVAKTEKLVFLDVGQGTGILICGKSESLVIDGGSVSSDKVGEYTIVPAIKYMGMAQVDYWFVSHGDIDHVSGLIYVLENYELLGIDISCIVLSDNQNELTERIIMLAEENSIEVIYMKKGDYIAGKDFTMECIHPDKRKSFDNINDESMCLRYVSGKFNALFLGDVSKEALDYIFHNNTDVNTERYNVIQVPHHGSKYSLSHELYNLLETNGTAVISCGYGFYYGHPHKEVMEALSGYDIDIRRTDMEGAVLLQ